MVQVKKVKRSDGTRLDIVRVQSNTLHHLGGRRTWVSIWNKADQGKGKKVIRRALGMPSEKGFDGQTIELDYDSMLDLGFERDSRDENGFINCNLEIVRADLIEQVAHHLISPDYDHRFAVRLALLSLVISILGIIN